MTNIKDYSGRTRIWGILLYTDNDLHLLALEHIINNYEYIYVIHNKDYNENEIKKEHIHVIVEFPNARYRNPIAVELNIESKFIRPIRYMNNALLYLIHANDSKKYKYSENDLIGTKRLLNKFRNAVDRLDYRSENEKLILIFDWLKKNKKYKLSSLINFCIEQNVYSEFRRNYNIIKDLSLENLYLYKKKSDK